MAKGSRASTVKANNVALKNKVFGPVETARTARLHAKLMALVAQPKPSESEGYIALDGTETTPASTESTAKVEGKDKMDVDATATATKGPQKLSKGKIEKKRVSKRKASIVFPKYKEGKKSGSKRR